MQLTFLRFAALATAAAALGACGYVPRIPGVTPHRIEIQQGNYVTQEMVSQLKPGMSKEQVRFALGTPLIADVFHADRWDYVFWREAPNGDRERRKLAVYFDKEGQLQRLDGDVVAAGAPKAEAPKETSAPDAASKDAPK